MAKKWDVFVSYATKDSRPVSHVVSDLESSGLSVWQDVSAIQSSSRIREAINKGIQSSKSFLVFLSKRSTKSRWVLNELDAAMVQEISNHHNFVITVLLGNISVDEIPADIQGKLFIDLRYNFQRKYLAQRTKLIQTLKLFSMEEQSIDDSIVIEIGREFKHLLIDYKYVGYNETFKISEKAINVIAEELIIGAMKKVWKESMGDTLKQFLAKFGSDMAQRVAIFALDNSGIILTNKFKPFTDEDIYNMAASTSVLMLSLLAAEELIEHDAGRVIKAKWTPGDKGMGFWMEESKS